MRTLESSRSKNLQDVRNIFLTYLDILVTACPLSHPPGDQLQALHLQVPQPQPPLYPPPPPGDPPHGGGHQAGGGGEELGPQGYFGYQVIRPRYKLVYNQAIFLCLHEDYTYSLYCPNVIFFVALHVFCIYSPLGLLQVDRSRKNR